MPETPISEWYTGYCWPIISSMRADWILLSHPTLGWGSSHSLLPICTPLASSSSESKMGPYMPHGWRETQELRCCQSRALRQGFVLEEQRKGDGEQNHQAVSLCEPPWLVWERQSLPGSAFPLQISCKQAAKCPPPSESPCPTALGVLSLWAPVLFSGLRLNLLPCSHLNISFSSFNVAPSQCPRVGSGILSGQLRREGEACELWYGSSTRLPMVPFMVRISGLDSNLCIYLFFFFAKCN